MAQPCCCDIYLMTNLSLFWLGIISSLTHQPTNQPSLFFFPFVFWVCPWFYFMSYQVNCSCSCLFFTAACPHLLRRQNNLHGTVTDPRWGWDLIQSFSHTFSPSLFFHSIPRFLPIHLIMFWSTWGVFLIKCLTSIGEKNLHTFLKDTLYSRTFHLILLIKKCVSVKQKTLWLHKTGPCVLLRVGSMY